MTVDYKSLEKVLLIFQRAQHDLAFVLTGAILAVSFSPAYGAQIE